MRTAPKASAAGEGSFGVSGTSTTAKRKAEPPATASFEFHNTAPGYRSSFYVLGKVTNTSSFPIAKAKIITVLLDSAGTELATAFGYSEADSIAPAETVPVKVLVKDPPSYEKLAFEVVARRDKYPLPMLAGLKLQSKPPRRDGSGRSWIAEGKVLNTSTQAARSIKVVIVSYDASDKMTNLVWVYADGEQLPPNQTTRYRATLLLEEPAARFEYSVTGRPVQ